MELGNMIFGNSRGEHEVPRTDEWSGPWEALTTKMGRSYRGYPENDASGDYVFENGVFVIRPYDWGADCDCGADEKMEAWLEAHPHSAECYQTKLTSEMERYDIESGYKDADKAAFGGSHDLLDGMEGGFENLGDGVVVGHWKPREDEAMEVWRKANEARRKHEDRVLKLLCKRHGLTYPNGCAVHCDCARESGGELFWREIGGHTDACRFVQPNFLFKPTGFRINWYKYPFRDAYMSERLDAETWRKMLRECWKSLAA